MVSKNYVETSTALLKTGLTNFENDLSNIERTSRSAYDNSRIHKISYSGPDYSIKDYYNTVTLVDDFKRYFSTADIIKDCGIIFNNDIILTNRRLHFSGEEFYGRFFKQQNITEYQAWLTELSINNSLIPAHIIPIAEFNTIESSYSALTYVQNFSFFPQKISLFFATLDSNYILSRLATSEVLQKGRVIMYDPLGKILMDSSPQIQNSRGKDIISIYMTGTKRGIGIAVDIPKKVFSDKLAPFRNIALIFSLILIAIGIILSFIFAQNSAKPVREIMEEVINFNSHNSTEGIPSDFKTDFKFIQHFISKAKWDYETFQEKIKHQEELQHEYLLIQLFYGLIYTTQAYDIIKKNLPDFPEKFRIAVINLPGMDETGFSAYTVRQTMLKNLIDSLLPPGGYADFSGNTLKLILPEEEPEKIIERLENLNAELKNKMNITGKIALSETVRDINKTHNVYHQMYNLLRLPQNSFKNIILQKENIIPFPFSIEYLDTSRLYELILHAEEERAIVFVDNMFSELCKGNYTDENDIQQIFFLYRRILIQIVSDLELDINRENVIPSYDSSQDIGSLFDRITKSIKEICGFIKTRHDEQNINFEKSIILYVDNNITNKNLFTKMVTLNFTINENRLQDIFRRWSGKSFLEYVETKRMVLAREILIKTNKSISQVTTDCGYSTDNAFYKAFKRYYNMAPSDLRKCH